MSEERRRRQQEKERAAEPPRPFSFRKVIIVVLIVAAFGAAYYLGVRKRTGRLDTFAQCVARSGTRMYGLYWCTHCADQKELFGSSFQYIPYVECGIKGQARGEIEQCKAEGVIEFPTWDFLGKEKITGVKSLPEIAEKTGCSLP